MRAETFTFYRPKVDKIQTHTMTPDTRNAARAYIKHTPADGIVWRKSSKGTDKLRATVRDKRNQDLSYVQLLYKDKTIFSQLTSCKSRLLSDFEFQLQRAAIRFKRGAKRGWHGLSPKWRR